MSTLDEKDIEDLLNTWMDTKQKIAELEKKCEKYKKVADKLLSDFKSNKLTSSSYILQKRLIQRRTLSKDNVPEDIWFKYSREIEYPSYIINRIKRR